jgi:hypothetical protein
MSSDLWLAFGGTSDGFGDNPWAQPSPQRESHQHLEEASMPQPKQTAPISEKNSPVDTRHQLPWAAETDIIPTLPTKLASSSPSNTEALSSREPNTGNEWSDMPRAGPPIPPWPAFTSSAPDGGESPKWEFFDDADFGDFEKPDINQSFRDLNIKGSGARDFTALGSSTRTEKKETFMGNFRPQHRKTQSYQVTDPYAGLDAVTQKRATAKKSTIAGNPVPIQLGVTRGRAPLLGQLDLDVPYANEEWGEFSPDPNTGSEADIHKPAIAKSIDNVVSQSSQHSRSRSEPPTKMDLAGKSSTSKSARLMSNLPPSNIPPPSILMPLISNLVQKLPGQVDAVLQRPELSEGSQKPLEKALRGCLASLRVAARIAAGRKVRWKRDTHLAQSMKIGPASGGKLGGMKLAGVDKAELQREDREAAEFVRMWKQHLGSIRSALATVNGQIDGSPLVLPDISDNMRVKTLKPVEGGNTAPKCCVFCGLKREERVEKVDTEVWDTFGEWWTESWGHTECKVFWTEHEKFLQQR